MKLFLEKEAYTKPSVLLEKLHKELTEFKNTEKFFDFSNSRKYDLIYDCRGIFAKEQNKDLRSLRGEALEVYAPEVHLKSPVRLSHPRYKIYIIPYPENRFYVGATQIESDSKHSLTVQSALELLSALYTVHPGFAEASIERIISGQKTQLSRC